MKEIIENRITIPLKEHNELTNIKFEVYAFFSKRYPDKFDGDFVRLQVTKKSLYDLLSVLCGPDDPYVKALLPQPKYRVGDWVVLHDPWASQDSPAFLVTEIREHGLRLGVNDNSTHWSHVRPATPEEIAKARGEA